MPRFRKKPVEIDAERISVLIHDAKDNWGALPAWFRDAYERGSFVIQPDGISTHTLEGQMFGGREDWLLRGIKGEFYPCKREIFSATYELIEAPPAA